MKNHKSLTIIYNLSRHARQRGELVRGSFRVLARQAAHQRALSDRRKADEADAGDARPGHIETSAAAATAAAARRKELPLQLGELGLELPQMVGRRLVLLGSGHLQER